MLSGCCREIVGKSPEGLERTRKDHPQFYSDFVADPHFKDGIFHAFIGLSWKVSQLFCNFRNFQYLCIP